MAEPGSLDSHRGHLHLTVTATPRGCSSSTGCSGASCAYPWFYWKLVRSCVASGSRCRWPWLQGEAGAGEGPGLASLALDRQTDRQTVVLPILISVLSWKICKWTTTLTPQPQHAEMTTHFFIEVLQPFCTSLSNAKSSSFGTRALNQNGREWESIAPSGLYLLLNTSPSCKCQHRERYITFFPISLTVPNFLQQIKVFSWRVRNLSLVLF